MSWAGNSKLIRTFLRELYKKLLMFTINDLDISLNGPNSSLHIFLDRISVTVKLFISC